MEDDKNITTVRLSEKALEIKRKLAPVFGMKNIVSAGLILLDRLSADQQKAVIAEANGGEPKPGSAAPEDAEIYADLDQLARALASVDEKIRRSEKARKKGSPRRLRRAEG